MWLNARFALFCHFIGKKKLLYGSAPASPLVLPKCLQMLKRLNALYKYCLLATLSVLAWTACLSDYDLRNLEVAWAPEVLVPLAHGRFVMEDMISLIYDDSLYLTFDEDSLMRIFYRQDSVYYIRARDLMDFPENFEIAQQEFTLGDFPLPDYEFETHHALQQLLMEEYEMDSAYVQSLDGTQFVMEEYNGDIQTEFSLDDVAFEEVEYAIISSANVEMVITNNYPVKLSFTGEVVDEQSNEQIVETRVEEVMPGETRVVTIPITNKRISSELKGRTSNAKVFGSEQPVTIALDATLDIAINIRNIRLKEGRGITPAFEITNRELLTFEVNEGYQLTEVRTKEASFEVSLQTSLPLTGTAVLSFPGFTQNGTSKTVEIPFNTQGNNTIHRFNLNNALLSFQGEQPSSFNTVEVVYTLNLNRATQPATIKNTDAFAVQLHLRKFDPLYIEGHTNTQTVELNKGVAEFPTDFWQQFDGELRFANPIIHFLMENSIGINNRFNVNFTGINQASQKVALNPPAFSVPYPSRFETEAKTSTVSIHKDNSNILEFIALPPDLAVEYSAFITLNPDATNTGEPNRIYPESYLKLGYEVEVPMQFSTTGIHFSKTFNLDSIKISGLETGTLRMKYANHIPLSFSMQTVFMDSISNQVMNTLEPFTVKAAQTNAEGRAAESTVDVVEIDLSKEFSETLKGANQLLVTGTFITPDEGMEEIKLYLNDYLDLKFILNAQFDIAGGLNDE